LWVIFALLDTGTDPDSESGSTDPIESGSNPDPQPWLLDTIGTLRDNPAAFADPYGELQNILPTAC
jgi:hypothetical protein